jgi:hypothetical protein
MSSAEKEETKAEATAPADAPPVKAKATEGGAEPEEKKLKSKKKKANDDECTPAFCCCVSVVVLFFVGLLIGCVGYVVCTIGPPSLQERCAARAQAAMDMLPAAISGPKDVVTLHPGNFEDIVFGQGKGTFIKFQAPW